MKINVQCSAYMCVCLHLFLSCMYISVLLLLFVPMSVCIRTSAYYRCAILSLSEFLLPYQFSGFDLSDY